MDIKRGDIWWVNLDPKQGPELDTTRPCLVLTSNGLNSTRNTVVVVPFSSMARAHPPITVAAICRNKKVVAVVDQIRAVAKQRLRSKIESLSEENLEAIESAVAQILDIP